MVNKRTPLSRASEDTVALSAEKYSEYLKKHLGKEYREFINHILNSITINPPQNAKCLEIGPGPGWISIWLAEKRRDLTIVGLEPSRDMIRVATANAISLKVADRVKFVLGYAENQECFPAGEFDLVISNESLHHWADPEKAFLEIRRVLKPDGKLFIKDGKRDLGLTERFVVQTLGRITNDKMWKNWKNSLNASYTEEELREILDRVPNHNWKTFSLFLSLSVESSKRNERAWRAL